MYFLILILVALFALNMGSASFAASFAAAHGGKVLSKIKSQILFAIFVFLGAICIGRPVAQTLGTKILSADFMRFDTVIVILTSATISLFLANLLHVPQSTSLVTVGSILGVGLFLRNFNSKTLLQLLPFWFFLPIIGYIFTYFLGRLVYPPRKSNFWIYEKLVNHQQRLRKIVIFASCYNAFSVGTNNVANAIGPVAGAGIINVNLGLALAAAVFGLGSLVFSGPLNMTSHKIVPLGLLTATILCLVSGTLMIIASLFGVPQSFVMIKVVSVFAISGLKNGHRLTLTNPLTKKTYLTWIITPMIAIIISFLLMEIRYVIFD